MTDQADSPQDQTQQSGDSGQEQGDQTARLNGLMSALGKRTEERDQARAETEDLKRRLNEMSGQTQRPTQVELMSDSGGEEEQAFVDDRPEPTEIPARDFYMDQNSPPRSASVPLKDKDELANWKRQLNALNQQHVQDLQARGLMRQD